MAFFNFFNKSTPDIASDLKLNWTQLNDLKQIEEIINLSKTKSVVVFKHSTRCNISKTVLKNFEKEFAINSDFALFFLDLLSFRQISSTISSTFQIIHESPQLLLIKNGVCIYSASHENISAKYLHE